MTDMKKIDKRSAVVAGASLLPIEIALAAFTHGGLVNGALGLAGAGIVYVALDEWKKKHPAANNNTAEESEESNEQPLLSSAQPTNASVWYRLTHGKEARGVQEQEDGEGRSSGDIPGRFLMDDVISVIQDFNRQGYIYFGDSINGAVVIHFDDLIHVLDISNSGNGKSNRVRLIMPQIACMAETYYINPLANKIKPVKDDRQYEVWTPIYDLLQAGPVKKAEDIKSLLAALADEIETRNEQEEREDFSWKDRPVALFIDELPEVFARCPDAPTYLDKIGRMGRQYCISMYLCSQTAQVKEIGLSNATQNQLKTKNYGGGDQTSANKTMKGHVPAERERILQVEKGLSIMLATGYGDAPFVRAPLVTNTGLFAYLGLPKFNLKDWVGAEKKERETSGLLPFDALPVDENPPKTAQQTVKQPSNIKPSNHQTWQPGPNYDAILDAVEALEGDNRALTLNAIATTANLTRNQYSEIEQTVTYAGYDIVRGNGGRPKER